MGGTLVIVLAVADDSGQPLADQGFRNVAAKEEKGPLVAQE